MTAAQRRVLGLLQQGREPRLVNIKGAGRLQWVLYHLVGDRTEAMHVTTSTIDRLEADGFLNVERSRSGQVLAARLTPHEVQA